MEHIGSLNMYRRIFSLVSLIMLGVLVSAPAGAIPTFQKAETCEFEEHDIQCGIVSVLEDRSTNSGPLLEIKIYIIKSHAAVPAPDPIVFLTGGPGIRSKNDVYTFYVLDTLREKRDIILVDQRGTDERTDLCPDLASEDIRLTYFDHTFKEAQERYRRRLDICFDRLRTNGRNVEAINNRESALDIRDVRIALGVDQWNIWGVSYGTALGLEVLLVDRDGIRAAVLDSVSPIDIPWQQNATANYYESLAKLSDLCLATSNCRLNYGDLAALRTKAIGSLTENPLRFHYFVDSTARAHGASSVGTLNDHDLAFIIHQLSYFDTDVNLVPLLLQAVLDRDSEVVSAIVTYEIENILSYGMDDGTNFAIACSLNAVPERDVFSGEPEQNEIDIPPYDDFRIAPYCRHLGLKPLQNRKLSFDRVTAPILLMSGEFDPVTPPKWGSHVADLLPNARHIIFQNGFHSMSLMKCGLSILPNFLDSPQGDYDVSCADDIKPIMFAGGLVKSGIGGKFVGYQASPIYWVSYAVPVFVLVIWLLVRGGAAVTVGADAVTHSRFAILLAALMVAYATWLVASLVQTNAGHSNIVWMGIGFVPFLTSFVTWMTPIGLVAGPILLVHSAKEMRQGTLAPTRGWEQIAIGLSVLWLCFLLAFDGVVPDLIRFF